MNNYLDAMKKIREVSNRQTLSAEQGLHCETVARGQLHRLKNQTTLSDDLKINDFFVLAWQQCDEGWIVIPGSMDGLMAGPSDIVLPASVLGQYIFLAIDKKMFVSEDSLAEGFARLDEATMRRVECSLAGDLAQDAQSGYPHALPYTGESDSRKQYHSDMETFLKNAVETLHEENRVAAAALHPPIIIPIKRIFAYAASLAVVGMLAIMAYQNDSPKDNTNSDAPTLGWNVRTPTVPNPPTAIASATRGVEDVKPLWAPQGDTFNPTPDLLLRGDKNQKYQITLYEDTEGKLLGTVDSYGESIIPWNKLSGQPMSSEDSYSIEIKIDGKIVGKRNAFWLSEHCQEIKTEILAGKSGDFVFGAIAVPETHQESLRTTTQILMQHHCYSDALVLLHRAKLQGELTKELDKLYQECLEKLGIQAE